MGYITLIIIYAVLVVLLWAWASGLFEKDESPKKYDHHAWFVTDKTQEDPYFWKTIESGYKRTKSEAIQKRDRKIEEYKTKGFQVKGGDERGLYMVKKNKKLHIGAVSYKQYGKPKYDDENGK